MAALPVWHQGDPEHRGVIGMETVLQFLAGIGMDRVREHEFALMKRARAP